MHYRKIWELHTGRSIPDGYEIHHIDGNNQNNSPENLVCVTIETHLQIHKDQGDWGAVQAILMRMSYSKEEISIAAALFQKKLMEEGRHNFQKIDRVKLSKKIIEQRIASGLPAFLGIPNTIENSRRAGKIAAEKNSGFLDVNSKNHGSKAVKGTYWWTNDNGERIRSNVCPGETWKRGMK